MWGHPLDYDEVLNLVYDYFCSLFPRTCSCGRTYQDLRNYIEVTTPVGPAISYDADREGEMTELVGSVAMANCLCGSTMMLATTDLDEEIHLKFLRWLRNESQRRRVSASDVLDQLRLDIRERALEVD